ncbi:GntR family transcriptional regulator (plasmid) [Rhizobium laguerreae]|uniref:GntR family transcriptional regulator n=1 Tax=Rhizobium laguerreae TaxID=1076926 RepID=UPI001441B17B|nr:GntR family transcriptional regulator [Rhizobium laguerreae]NKM67529.1 GntR family transcriptional regulator [Rhizobium laguerreae]UFW67093.1 GntR family transcriptional regulator [Rhizobium laguerreae]
MRCCKNAPPQRGADTNFATEPEPAKADIAYDAIRRILHSNGRVPGQHLREQDLASKLDLGRTPIREALQRLAAEGKIQYIPQKGFFTRPMLEGTLLDFYVVGRETLISALNRKRPQVPESWAVADKLSPDELALTAEAIFTKIAEEASNCEACKIVQRFCFCTHPLRMEITASELRPAFVESLGKLIAAMSELGAAMNFVEDALMNHLDLERGAVPKVVQEVNERGLTGFPGYAKSL